MGTIPEAFPKAKSVMRSDRPHLSFAALGPHTLDHAPGSSAAAKRNLAVA
jgi:aminoglycoside N3'-acetyltransferase